MPVPHAVEEWSKLHAELLGDVMRAASDAHSAKDGYCQRAYVRTVFASIEGDLFGLRQVTLEHMKNIGFQGFSEDDIEKLLEIPLWVGCKSKPRFLPFADTIKFTFQCVARVHALQFKPDYNSGDWKALQDGVKVRDRLMHPKHLADLTVSEHEHLLILRGARWYHGHRNRLTQLMAETLRTTVNNRNAVDFLARLDSLCQNSTQSKP